MNDLSTPQLVLLPLTNPQLLVFKRIRSFIYERRRPPSYTELRRMIGCSSNHTVAWYLDDLEKKGYITRIYRQKASLRLGSGDLTGACLVCSLLDKNEELTNRIGHAVDLIRDGKVVLACEVLQDEREPASAEGEK